MTMSLAGKNICPKNSLLLLIAVLLAQISFTGTSAAQMFWNHAGNFAGTASSYVSCKGNTSLNLTGNFTVQAWINASTLSGLSKGIIAKGGAKGTSLNYGLRLETSGRVAVIVNGSVVLRTKISTQIQAGKWYHITAINTNATYSVFVNGSLDTSAFVSGIFPVSNTDSLFIGISGSTTPFQGLIDEVRIWNRGLPATEVYNTYRLSLGANGGIYSGLVLSVTFQNVTWHMNPFTAIDWSNNGNNGVIVGVSPANFTDMPSETIAMSQSVYFNSVSGTNDYMAAPDHAQISPTAGITLQAWVRPISSSDGTIIHKGSPTGGAGTNYSLNIINRKLAAIINGVTYDSQDALPGNTWSHVAFTYYFDGVRRYYRFFVDGNLVRAQFLNGGSNITDGTDSLYIGGTIPLTDFRGYIDEVRISSLTKTQSQIADSMYTSMMNGAYSTGNTVTYNLDGFGYSSASIGPMLFFRNNAFFTYPNSSVGYGISPLVRTQSGNFQGSFFLKSSYRSIPEIGNTGGPMVDDTLEILLDETITDIDVYIALNYTEADALQVSIIAPDETTVQLVNNNSLLPDGYHIITIFDDQAASPMADNKYISFSPTIKPLNDLLASMSGKSTRGAWRLSVNTTNGSGTLHAWGLRFNNKTILPRILECRALLQGFYESTGNIMQRDTVRCYIRNFSAPYDVIDSAKAYLRNDGTGSFTFDNPVVQNLTSYYVQLKHRNSLETWSTGNQFAMLTSQGEYDLAADSSKAYGANVIRVDAAPLRYALYGGDVNQDGTIDATDVALIDNDAANFAGGYVVSDLTGDDFVDGTDFAIADNNAANFISVIRP